MSVETQDFVTRSELNIHLKGIDDRISFNEHVNDVRIAAIEQKLDNHLEIMKAIMEKNLAQNREIASEMRAEINEIRGDVKALSAKVDSIQIKFGWYLALFGIGISALIFLAQKIWA